MTTNNINQRLKQIQAYDSSGSQTIIQEHFAKKAIALLDLELLQDPKSKYLDPQCGSGTLLMYLAQRLMQTLELAIPNEVERAEHIFTKQIFASDIDSLQVLVCNTNFKKALDNKQALVNVLQQPYEAVTASYSAIISSLDFVTTNKFVKHFKAISDNVLVLTRPNKNRYTRNSINEISKYRFLGVASTNTPICAMYFKPKNHKKVEFVTDNESVMIDDPKYLPGYNLKSYLYAEEILHNNFDTFDANYGSYYINHPSIVNNPGNVELIFQVGRNGEPFRKTVGVDESIITPREGVGKHKVVISKNGNRAAKSILKYAEPKYGTGHNAIWIQTQSKQEADKIITYYNSPEVTRLIMSLKETSPANGVGFWAKIPHYKNQEKIKKIYDKYFS